MLKDVGTTNAQGEYAQAWWTYGHGHTMAWVYGFRLTRDISSYARVQRTKLAWVQGSYTTRRITWLSHLQINKFRRWK